MVPALKLLWFKAIVGATGRDPFINMEIKELEKVVDYGKRRIINIRSRESFINDDLLREQILIFFANHYRKIGPVWQYLIQEYRGKPHLQDVSVLQQAKGILQLNLESLGVERKHVDGLDLDKAVEAYRSIVTLLEASPQEEA
jgi:hypothetical protein